MAKTSKDPTQQVLEELLSLLHHDLATEAEASVADDPSKIRSGSYLLGPDNQFLGAIGPNNDQNSLLNKYGPYGSRYSPTSIFNDHSPYGSPNGAFSVNNPACPTPPRLYINGSFAGEVSLNERLPDQIPTPEFLELLRRDTEALSHFSKKT